MKLAKIFSSSEVKKIVTLSELDLFFLKNQGIIEDACRIADNINGVPVRISTAVVLCRTNGDIYAYRRTNNYVWMAGRGKGGIRRGLVDKWDTPKGKVPFVDAGKWLVDEKLVTGQVLAVGIATEYRPMPEVDPAEPTVIIPAEFVVMPVILFQADETGEQILTDHLGAVPNRESVKVEGFAWVPSDQITAETSMSKLVVAIQLLEKCKTA